MLPHDAPILALADELDRAVRRLRTNIEDEQPTAEAQAAVHAKLNTLESELLAQELTARATVLATGAPLAKLNRQAREGQDRCYCGCKYWEDDACIDCGTDITECLRDPEWKAANR